MFLSRLTRSLSHSSRSVISGNYNSLRILSPKQPVFPSCGPQLNSLVSKPTLLRLFSSEVLKLNKNYRKYLPNGANEIKKEGSGGAKYYILLCFFLLLPHINCLPEKSVLLYSTEERINKFLRRPDLIDSIFVTENGIVKVYIKSKFVDLIFSAKGFGETSVESWLLDRIDVTDRALGKYKYKRGDKIGYYFEMESVESFEKQLKEAQQELGTHPRNYIPVRSENWLYHLGLWSFCWKIFPSAGGTLYVVRKIARIV